MKILKIGLTFCLGFLVILTAFLTGCELRGATENTGSMALEAIVEKIYEKVDVPPYDTVRLDQDNFEFFSFIPYSDDLSAVAADALVNITPHSVVVIRSESGNGAEIAESVVLRADPNKWLCVGAETVEVAYTDHYVVLVMSDKTTADAIVGNFGELAPDLDDMEMKLLTAGNSRYDQ